VVQQWRRRCWPRGRSTLCPQGIHGIEIQPLLVVVESGGAVDGGLLVANDADGRRPAASPVRSAVQIGRANDEKRAEEELERR
jgi:hypothetical protein